MDPQTKNIISIGSIISASVVISRLNPEIKDFFSSELILIILITLGVFEQTKDILTSLAVSVLGTMVIKIAMMKDIGGLVMEPFKLLYPGPNSSSSCLNVTESDLLNRFSGNKSELKKNMVESGVPHNMYLDDTNAPEIATYLINNPRIKNVTSECKL